MRFFAVAAVTAAALLGMCVSQVRADAQPPQISGPFTQGNLAIYFVHGESAPGRTPLTLQEGMAKGIVRVVETGSVNELKIENTGNEDVYIQSGDIVKGGRQDRVLSVSFVLPRKSGEKPVAAYCVEHGRWSQRGAEDVKRFVGSDNSLPSREAKLAMKAPLADAPAAEGAAQTLGYDETGKRQHAVWGEVAKTQKKLSEGAATEVASPASATSLELSLENDKLKALRAEFVKALEDKPQANDIVGFVFAVNGQINSADIYPSNGLFRKMWPKLLNAGVTEALGEKREVLTAPAPSVESVRAFLAAAETGKANAEKVGSLALQETRDAETALYVQAAKPNGEWVHRNYLAK